MIGDDLTPFFNTSHFAKAATYNGSTTVNGVFQDEYIEKGGIAGVMPVFTCAESDVSAVANGDTLLIDSVTYTVREHMPDGTGVIKLVLESA